MKFCKLSLQFDNGNNVILSVVEYRSLYSDKVSVLIPEDLIKKNLMFSILSSKSDKL